jgi:hypothetical protein
VSTHRHFSLTFQAQAGLDFFWLDRVLCTKLHTFPQDVRPDFVR